MVPKGVPVPCHLPGTAGLLGTVLMVPSTSQLLGVPQRPLKGQSHWFPLLVPIKWEATMADCAEVLRGGTGGHEVLVAQLGTVPKASAEGGCLGEHPAWPR